MQQMAAMVGENLHFEMARSSDVFLQEDGGIAKCRAGFALGLFQFCFEVGGVAHHAHAASATAHGGLHNDWKPDLAPDAMRLLRGLDRFFGAGQNWNARRCSEPPSRGLVPQQLEQSWRRPKRTPDSPTRIRNQDE